MATIGLGGTTGSSSTTTGGYPVRNPGAMNSPNRTGLWRSAAVPYAPQPVTRKEMRQGQRNAQYTYRQYSVPQFENSDLIGMPANSYLMINGQAQGKNWEALQNTQSELNRIAAQPAEELKKLQNAMIQRGWLPKNQSTGRPTEKTMSAIAFMMDQGNQLGENWKNILDLGPKGLKRMGGADLTQGGPGGEKYGTTTSTSSAVNYSTKASARNYLRQALADVLGRGPEAGEVDEFLDLLRTKEAKNPRIGTTVTTTSPGGTDQQTTTEGGFGEEEASRLAENFARDQNPKQAKRYAKAGYEQMLDSLIMGG